MAGRAEWDAALGDMERELAGLLADAARRHPVVGPPSRPATPRLVPTTGAEWDARLRAARRAADEADAALRDHERACANWLGAFAAWRRGLEQLSAVAAGGDGDGARGGDSPGGR